MTTQAIRVEMKGPLLERGSQEIRRLGEGIMKDVVAEGEMRLNQILRPRPSGVFLSVAQARRGQASTGHYRRSLNAFTRGLHGRLDDGNVAYGPWLEGVGRRNQTTRFKGYHSFRNTAQWLQKRVKKIAGSRLRQFVRRN